MNTDRVICTKHMVHIVYREGAALPNLPRERWFAPGLISLATLKASIRYAATVNGRKQAPHISLGPALKPWAIARLRRGES